MIRLDFELVIAVRGASVRDRRSRHAGTACTYVAGPAYLLEPSQQELGFITAMSRPEQSDEARSASPSMSPHAA